MRSRRPARVMIILAVMLAMGCETFQNKVQKLQVQSERKELKGMIDRVPEP